MSKEWEYYNHALVPTTAPDVAPDISWMKDRKMWKKLADGKYPLFARWITDFDCHEDTGWWYCIKDDPFDLSSLKYKRRRVINQGLQWVEVKWILPCEYAELMADINLAARLGYGESLDVEKEKSVLVQEFSSIYDLESLGNREYLGAFLKESDKMIGYGIYEIFNDWVDQSVIKTHPDYLKYNVNAAMVYYAIEHYMGEKSSIKYISNGSKNISHKTNYHEYLMKYFGFRKAYCRLHVRYRTWVHIVIALFYPFRNLLKRFSGNTLIHQLVGVLTMEEIVRNQQK